MYSGCVAYAFGTRSLDFGASPDETCMALICLVGDGCILSSRHGEYL